MATTKAAGSKPASRGGQTEEGDASNKPLAATLMQEVKYVTRIPDD